MNSAVVGFRTNAAAVPIRLVSISDRVDDTPCRTTCEPTVPHTVGSAAAA
jgi:hypothetical protein